MKPESLKNSLFKPSRDSAPPPVEVAIDHPGDSKAGVREALDRHALFTGHGEQMEKVVASRTDDDAPPANFEPAKSADELHAQGAKLIAAFRAQESRDPTPHDEEFWATYAYLTEAYVANLGKARDLRKSKRRDPIDALDGLTFAVDLTDLEQLSTEAK